MTDIRSIWSCIETWLATEAPSVLTSLNAGASDGEIASFEAKTGLTLPTDVRQSYQVHNGAVDVGLFGGLIFLSLEQARRERAMMNDIGFGLSEDMPNVGEPVGPIEPLWWSEAWIPFLQSASGDLICFDLQPAPNGGVGQVIEFIHDDPKRTVLAPTFTTWLAQFSEKMATGGYMNDDGWIELSAPSAESQGRSAGAIEADRIRALLKALIAEGDIIVKPKLFESLVDDVVDIEPRGPGAGMRVYALLMEHEAVEEVFVSQDQLASRL